MHILITGAAGSGTSTLAAALANAIQATCIETDDYFWLPSDPPYQHKREGAERSAVLLRDISNSPGAVVAGSLIDWGPELEDAFDLVVFLYIPTELRLARLKLREEARFGNADPAFLAWAAQYDEGTAEGRSLGRHRLWLRQRKCRVLCLEGDLSTEERLQRVLAASASLPELDI